MAKVLQPAAALPESVVMAVRGPTAVMAALVVVVKVSITPTHRFKLPATEATEAKAGAVPMVVTAVAVEPAVTVVR